MKILSLILAFSFLCSFCHAQDKLYIQKNQVQMVDGKPMIRDFLPMGIKYKLMTDVEGYYIPADDIVLLKKGKFEYHYCNNCDQEFCTKKSYKNHVCKRDYYERQDRGYRIADHYRSVWDRPSEFNRPSEFSR